MTVVTAATDHSVTTLAKAPVLPGRRATGALLVLATIAEIIEEALSPLKDTTTSADLGAIASHTERFEVSVLIGMVGTLLFIPGFLGLANICAARTPRWARISGWLMVAVMVAFAAVRMSQAVELQTVRDGIPRGTSAHLIEHIFLNPIGLPLAIIFLAGQVVGLILLGVTVWRAGFSRVAAVLLGVFPVADKVSETVVGAHGPVISHTLLLLALATIARTLFRPHRANEG